MARTFIGIDAAGKACLKVTKNSADDPRTTPDADRHKFFYNSNDHKVAEIATIQLPIEINTGGSWVYTGGAGTSADFVTAHRGNYFAPGSYYYESYFTAVNYPGLDYYCPLVDYAYKDASGHWESRQYYGVASGFTPAGGYDMIGPRVKWNYTFDTHYTAATGHVHRAGWDADIRIAFTLDTLRDSSNPVAFVWNLPGDNTAVNQAAPGSVVSGQKSIEITPTAFKIAKPGFDVSTATKAQLAFAATKKPAKVIATGDIAIAATSTTTHDIGFTVDGSVYIDVQFYETGGLLHFPATPAANLIGGKYYVSGSTLYFVNAGVACRARFVVIGVDLLGPSSGSNKVFNTFDEGGQKIVRILAPGSNDPPRLSDIVVDSRWPTLPILAEGYVSVTGVQTDVISFTNPGLLPFVKLSVIRLVDGSKLIATPPNVRRLRRDGSMGGDTVYAVTAADGNSVTLYSYRGNPTNVYVSDPAPILTYEYDPTPVVGIRYYIFGIPV